MVRVNQIELCRYCLLTMSVLQGVACGLWFARILGLW